MENSIAGTDVGQEGVTESGSFMGPLYQTRNINYIQICWYLAVNRCRGDDDSCKKVYFSIHLIKRMLFQTMQCINY